MAFEVGQRVGDYEIVQLLGVGGMGHVYRVRNVISDRTEAMKVLLPDLTAERDLAIRFISEIRTLASFDHPNIALLHTAFQADNQLIMMMEFVEGSTLEQKAKQGPMTIEDVAGYTYQALSALAYAHSRSIVHRDIKPANIMITSHGIVKLMDFGIAKSKVETHLTQPGTTIGSLYYMSPEQVRGDAVDGRSDLYSVGIMLYELMAGRRPFEADTTFSILNQQLNTPPQPPIELNPNLPAGMNQIILKALAKDPNQRYQTADEFRDALRAFVPSHKTAAPETVPVAVPPPSVPVAGVAAAALAEVASATQTMGASSAPPPPFQPVTAPPPVASSFPTPPPTPSYGAVPVQQPSQSFPPPVQQRSGGGKGMWIITGIAAAILAMVGVAYAGAHFFHIYAGSKTSSTTDTPQAPAQTDANTNPVVTDTSANKPETGQPEQPPVGSGAKVTPTPHATGQAQVRQAANDGQQQVAPVVNQPSVSKGPSQAELEQQQDRYTEMGARASAVDSSLDRMRNAQAADGYGLRRDMDSADNRMRSYLAAAERDLNQGNVASAEKHLNQAEMELNTLEKFLGK